MKKFARNLLFVFAMGAAFAASQSGAHASTGDASTAHMGFVAHMDAAHANFTHNHANGFAFNHMAGVHAHAQAVHDSASHFAHCA